MNTADPQTPPAAAPTNLTGLYLDNIARIRDAWIARVYVAGALALLALVAAVAVGTPPGPYRVLAVVSSLGDTAAIVLWVGGIGVALMLIVRDARAGFECFAAPQPVSVVTFAAAKAAAGVTAFAALLLVLELETAALLVASGGGYAAVEAAGHVALIAASVMPYLLLTETFAVLLPFYAAIIPVLFILGMSTDFALDRARAISGLLESSAILAIEKVGYWLLPRVLIDPLTRELLVARATRLNDFPGDDNSAVFGGNLVLVSQPRDYIYWVAYLGAMFALLCLATWLRARRARQVVHVPAWGRYAKE